MWAKHLLQAFLTDDSELAEIALESSLADVNDRVMDGFNGGPLSIGEFGFYAEIQFSFQADLLKQQQRDVTGESDYLSQAEWETVDKNLTAIGSHGVARFKEAYRGDSFAALAIRSNAFATAGTLLNKGIDPLIVNENGDDLFDIVKKQYGDLGTKLKEVQDLKLNSRTKILVPSDLQDMVDQERKTIENLENLNSFIDQLANNLQTRNIAIEKDKMLLRKHTIKNEVRLLSLFYCYKNYF